MNAIKSIFLTSLALLAGAAAAHGQDFRTDINPALRYYQAMIIGDELSPADHDYLFTNEWRGQTLPAKFGELVSGFDSRFMDVRVAGHATVPCEWGIDMSPGPETLLPHLGRLKALAVTGKLRVLWELQNGKETEARDDLIGAFVMGRNASQDRTLIAVLVRFAIENIAMNTVAENFHAFSSETLQQLIDGFDAAPDGITTSISIMTGEKPSFVGWLERKITRWQEENPGDDAKVMANVRDLGRDMNDESGTNQWEKVMTAAGTSDGLLKLVKDDEARCDTASEIMALPHGPFEEQAKQFQENNEKDGNPLVMLMMPSIVKARGKEFRTEAKLAMIHAAVAYKTHGEEGFRGVNDPLGQGPFQFERFVFEGVDRGFKLTSAYAGNGYPEAMIFVETDGTPFVCDGAKLGQPLSK